MYYDPTATILKSDENRFCIDLGENVRILNILWQVLTNYLIKYPAVADGVAFPARCCQVLGRWSEILATWLRGDGRQHQLSGWFSVSSSAPLIQCLLLSVTTALRPTSVIQINWIWKSSLFVQTISFDFHFLDVADSNETQFRFYSRFCRGEFCVCFVMTEDWVLIVSLCPSDSDTAPFPQI